tara:strand:+ start:10952 stop:13642 length:2691 start_codon:yes stop_codon:yes gene_type:complete
MSFKTEIEAIVGDIDSPDYTSEAGLYLTEGLKYILKYVSRNRDMAQKLTSNAILNNTSTTLDTSSILSIVSVTRGDGTRNREALEVAFENFDDYKDTNSIYYSSKFDPVYSIINDTLYVQPEPTATQNAVVRKIQPAAISLGGTSVDNVPDELHRGIVLYASKEMLRKFLSTKNAGLPANLTLPSVPSAGSVATVTLGSLGTAPTYSKTALTLTSAPSISSLNVSASVPSVITLGTVAYTDASVGDASTTGEAVGAITIPSIADANVTTVVPAYTKTALTLTSAPSISALTISASVPSTINLTTVSYTDASAADASAGTVSAVTTASVADANVTTSNSAISALPAYAPASINMTGAPGISNLDVSENPPSAPSIVDVGVGSLGSAPAYAPPSLALDFGTLSGTDTTAGTESNLGVDDFIYEEDVELAQISLQKMGVQIDKYQSDIQNQLNEFNENMTAYNANVQKIMKQADMEESESLQGIQKYAQEINSYQATINKKVQEWQVNTEKELQLWQTKRQTELQQYSADIQNNLNEYQEHLNVYQVEVQEELAKQNVALDKVRTDAQIAAQKAQQDAAATTDVAKFNKEKDLQISMEARARDMEAIISNNNAIVADYQARVQSYGQQVNDQLQEYRANLERELQLFQLKRTTEIQKHQNDIQDELNEFNKDNVRYQAEVQEELTKHNTALQKAIAQAQIDAADAQQESEIAATRNLANMNKDLQIKLEAAAKDMEVIISQNNAKVADYQARVQSYQAQVAEQVQEYQVNLEKELGLFNAKRNTELQKHQNDIQDELNEYQKELSIYQADLQHKIQQSELSSEKEAMEIQQYATEVESYGQQVVKEVQNFTTKLQKITTDYQWYVDQYNKVSRDLVEFLSYYMVVPQIQEQGNEATAND